MKLSKNETPILFSTSSNLPSIADYFINYLKMWSDICSRAEEEN